MGDKGGDGGSTGDDSTRGDNTGSDNTGSGTDTTGFDFTGAGGGSSLSDLLGGFGSDFTGTDRR